MLKKLLVLIILLFASIMVFAIVVDNPKCDPACKDGYECLDGKCVLISNNFVKEKTLVISKLETYPSPGSIIPSKEELNEKTKIISVKEHGTIKEIVIEIDGKRIIHIGS